MISTTNMKDVSQIFETYRKNYKKVNPDDDLEEILKRRLPKVCVNNTVTEIITLVNDVLKVHINKEDSISIEDLHALTYCGAQTVIKLCKKNNIAVYDQSEIPNKFPEEENDQKKLYKISPQRFIRLLFNKEMKEVPSEDIRNFYSELWNTQREFNKEEADFYMQQEQLRIAERIECKQDFQKVTESQLRKILKKKKNWAPAGVDGIQYFWYKKLKPIREILLNKINKIITREEEMPDFFTVGLTEFFTKEENPKGPSEYRPITHLPAVYKIITRCVYEKVLEHYQKYGILADEQCGGRKDCYGVRKALVVDSIAQSQNELYGYYIDFKKKFDTLSHKWVIKMLQTYKVDKTLVSFLENTMTKWRTRFYFMPDFLTDSIILKRGVFHGDCISVLLFWTAINPLSFVLNTGRGLTLKNGGVFSHILYMDDLKLYASDDNQLEKNFEEVCKFSKAVNIEINEKKSFKFSILRENKNGNGIKNGRKKKSYLGCIQNPRFINNLTVCEKVWKFDEKFKHVVQTKILEEDKIFLKKNFLFNKIVNCFGVLHWRDFKLELLKVPVKERCLVLEGERRDLPSVYLKLINDMCKMRRKFYNEEKNSKLMENIIKNDAVTPLKLLQRDEKEYISSTITELFQERNANKFKKISKISTFA